MTQPDVIVVGAGPAGSVAATVLARRGVRVLLLDRARFPRHKLCGDSLNPGALAILRRLGVAAAVEAEGLRIQGMLVSGDGGVTVAGRYPAGLSGCAITRSRLDAHLVSVAVSAGATFLDQTSVRRPVVEERGSSSVVAGVACASGSSVDRIRAPITIAADGRHSTLAFALRLVRHPAAPRRWAIGLHVEGFGGLSAYGEMHIRRGYYIGVAPLPGGVANVCVVRPGRSIERALGDPAARVLEELAGDSQLRERAAAARVVTRPVVLGPLAVDPVPSARTPEGLLLAGDACGFVDPMTGDGLRFALRGGELAAEAALRVMERGWDGVHAGLDCARRAEFAAKWRFNRALRALVGSSAGVWAASRSARVAPAVVRALITRASDCHLAEMNG